MCFQSFVFFDQASKFQVSTSNETINTSMIYRTGVLAGDSAAEALRHSDKGVSVRENDRMPTQFDARKRWRKCASMIGHVPDQGNCESGWVKNRIPVVLQ